MKKIYLLILVAISLNLSAQKKNDKKTEEPSNSNNVTNTEEVTKKIVNEEGIYRTVLTNSLKYNDVSTAILACHYLLAVNPQNTTLKDTLAMLYFESRSFLQTIMLAGEILQSNPDNSKMLEIQAIAQQNLGLIKESLETYEKLYKKTKSLLHAYQIATLQFALKRYGECEATLAQIIQDTNSEKEKVNVIIGNQGQQEVIIKAACLNMAGVIYMEQNQDDKAKKLFEEALKIDKDFLLPKGNLDYIANKNKPKETPKK